MSGLFQHSKKEEDYKGSRTIYFVYWKMSLVPQAFVDVCFCRMNDFWH